MKKLLLLLLVFPFVLGSCSSSDDDTPPSLKSTVWEGGLDNTESIVTFSELESTWVLSSTVVNHSISSAYTYTYKHPKVTLYPTKSDNAKIEGVVSDDYKTMVLTNTSSNKIVARLTKK